MRAKLYYKLARPDGYDFYTGNTIMYRGESYPHTVRVPNPDPNKGLCSSGLIHASRKPNDCFVGAKVPCSAYRVNGEAVVDTFDKSGFTELKILEEITDLDGLFGWRYSEAANPINPFKLSKRIPTDEDIELLRQWASVWDSVRVSVGAYIGSMFPIKEWKYIKHKRGEYPYQPVVDLWKRGLVPSFDGTTWRLHSGEKAEIMWEGKL